MPEKNVAAFVGSPEAPSEPATSVVRQPRAASPRLRDRATCAEPPRGKKKSEETTRRLSSTTSQTPDRPTPPTHPHPNERGNQTAQIRTFLALQTHDRFRSDDLPNYSWAKA